MLREFKELTSKHEFIVQSKEFNLKEEGVDEFYYRVIGNKSDFIALFMVVKPILILSHGNACVEAGFSVNNDLLLPNLKQRTIVSQSVVYDFVEQSGRPLSVNINDELIKSVRIARQRLLNKFAYYSVLICV